MQGNTESKNTAAEAALELPSIDWLNWVILQQDADELIYYMHGGELRDGWEEWMEGFESEMRAAKAADAELRRLISTRQKRLEVIFRDIRDLAEELAKSAVNKSDLTPYITGITQAVADGLELISLGSKKADDSSKAEEEVKQ